MRVSRSRTMYCGIISSAWAGKQRIELCPSWVKLGSRSCRESGPVFPHKPTYRRQSRCSAPGRRANHFTQIRRKSSLSRFAAKNILVPNFGKSWFLVPRPASMKRGERVVTIVRRDAMDVMMPRDERRSLHAAKACGPGALVAGANPRVESRGTVTQKPVSPGRARYKPSNHRAGNADVLADL
jgi:hypothetical protein